VLSLLSESLAITVIIMNPSMDVSQQVGRKSFLIYHKVTLEPLQAFKSREGKQTVLDLEEWLQPLEEIESPAEVRLRELKEHLNDSDELLGHLDFALNDFSRLKVMYEQSVSKTQQLQELAEQLTSEQQSLIVARDKISETLSFFQEYESLSKKLSTPSHLIINDSLGAKLSKIDECILFMESKSSYLEAADYASKFKFLQHQALFAVKNHILQSIQTTARNVMPESGQSLSPGDSVFTLFYAQFQTSCHRIKSFVELIEDRTSLDPKYSEFLSECHATYVACRETLMTPVLVVSLEEMVSSHGRNYCSLVRNSSQMMMHVCRDEFSLFNQFFSTTSTYFDEFLDSLCLRLYNCLRPIVIHLNHFETLSELCLLIKEEVMDDFVSVHSMELRSFGSMMDKLLKDIQERLVYRTNIYVEENIKGYKPSPGDLAYPEKLLMMEEIAECLVASATPAPGSHRERSDSVMSNALSDISLVSSTRNWNQKMVTSLSPADVHGMWYPTVRRTVLCLTKLYRSLDNNTFQGMSQDVVVASLISLEEAAERISSSKTDIDAFLFLIKHLLIVREQIAPFHIECTIREVNLDFDKFKTAAIDLISGGKDSIFSVTTNNSLLRLFLDDESPLAVSEQVFDPKKILDTKIKRVCERFITSATESIASSLIKFVHLVRSIRRTQVSVRSQEAFSTPDSLTDKLNSMRKQLKTQVPLIKKSMSLYLSNNDTQSILFKPVCTNILSLFDEVRKFVTLNFTPEEQCIIQCPSQEEVHLLLDLS
jgi:hypothetical protein